MGKFAEIENEIDLFTAKIHEFATAELGCDCPEHVFEQIRVLKGEASPGKAFNAIVIGEQLLVLFGDYAALDPFDYEMPRLVLSGITYRDSMGLNRLRLVLGNEVPVEYRKMIDEELTKYDDKVHVHYMD